MIYFFGDSHTAGMGKMGDYTNIPYSVHLAKLMNLDYEMHAECGLALNLSVDRLICNLDKIKKGDFVLFQFQTLFNCRYRFNKTNERFNWKETDGMDNLSLKDKNLILDFYSKFVDAISMEEVDRVYLIFDYLTKRGVKCNILYWCNMDYYIDSEYNLLLDEEKYVQSYYENNIKDIPKFISDETDIDDKHLSNPMNKVIAGKIYETNYKTN